MNSLELASWAVCFDMSDDIVPSLEYLRDNIDEILTQQGFHGVSG